MLIDAALALPQLPALRRLHCYPQVSGMALISLAAAAPQLRTLALLNCGDEDSGALTAAGLDAGMLQMRNLRVLQVRAGGFSCWGCRRGWRGEAGGCCSLVPHALHILSLPSWPLTLQPTYSLHPNLRTGPQWRSC